jgi:hypothetical protein
VYEAAVDLGIEITYFFVQGENNPADDPSRSSQIGDPLRWRRDPYFVQPPLCDYFHPYVDGKHLLWWQV